MITPSPFTIKWLPRTGLKHILTFVFFTAPVLKHFLPSTEKQIQFHRLQVPINTEVQRTDQVGRFRPLSRDSSPLRSALCCPSGNSQCLGCSFVLFSFSTTPSGKGCRRWHLINVYRILGFGVGGSR